MKINEIVTEGKTGPGLWANIHAKRERIKSGSGEKMRKPGSKGAPTAKNFKDAASEGYEGVEEARKANTVAARRELGKRNRKEDPAQQDKKKQESDEAWQRLMQYAADQKKDVAEGKLKCSCHPGDSDPDCAVHGLEPMDVGDALDESIIEETYEGDEFYEAYGDLWYDEELLNEAEYQGRKVQLGKPMRGDVKKFKVFVKDPSTGNVKKVNFGDPNMKIRKSNPKARKSFRARHNCDNPGPRTKARYWSCRKW